MPLTPDTARLRVEKLHKVLTARRTEVKRLNDYFGGDHKLEYASPQWRAFHQDRYKGFSDNWCGVVANSPAERIRVDGFRLEDQPAPLSDDEQLLARDWQINALDGQSSQGFLQSIIAKRSSVLVWGNNDDEPVVTWERPDQVVVEYDAAAPMQRTAALKVWLDNGFEHATLYLPDEVWKFRRPSTSLTVVGSGNWTRRPVDGEQWPIRNPIGLVPVVEFLNRPMLGGEPLSDIQGTIAMQDAINLLWAYLFNAADYASMPARVVMGQEPPKIPILNDQGQVIGERPVSMEQLAQGRLLWLTGQNTQIGQWDAAKLDVFTSVINVAVRHTAAQTRTPVHYIVGELNNVNGETLLAGETGLVKKVEEAQLFYGPGVREVHRLMALVRGRGALAEACRLGTVVWANAETRTQAQQADALMKLRQLGFPFQWIAERYGLTQAEVARVMSMREAEADDPTMARIMREFGGQPTPPEPAEV